MRPSPPQDALVCSVCRLVLHHVYNISQFLGLDASGVWHLFQTELLDGALSLTRASEEMRLANLSLARHEVAITRLSDSHVLLAGVATEDHSEVVLLLWDLRYSVVLASQKVPIPSTILSGKDGRIRLSLLTATSSQAIIVLSPTASTIKSSQGTTSRSSVLAVPLTVPSTSSIANAMGRASATQLWVASRAASTSFSPMDKGRMKLVDTMRNAIRQNRVEAADSAFFGWAEKNPEAEVRILEPTLQTCLIGCCAGGI